MSTAALTPVAPSLAPSAVPVSAAASASVSFPVSDDAAGAVVATAARIPAAPTHAPSAVPVSAAAFASVPFPVSDDAAGAVVATAALTPAAPSRAPSAVPVSAATPEPIPPPLLLYLYALLILYLFPPLLGLMVLLVLSRPLLHRFLWLLVLRSSAVPVSAAASASVPFPVSDDAAGAVVATAARIPVAPSLALLCCTRERCCFCICAPSCVCWCC